MIASISFLLLFIQPYCHSFPTTLISYKVGGIVSGSVNSPQVARREIVPKVSNSKQQNLTFLRLYGFLTKDECNNMECEKTTFLQLSQRVIMNTIFFLSIFNAAPATAVAVKDSSLEKLITRHSSSFNIAADEGEPRFYFQRAYKNNIQQDYTNVFQQISADSYAQIEKAKVESQKALVRAQEQQQIEAARREAKLKEYDDMFDKDARERDVFYGAKAAAKIEAEKPLLAQESQSTQQKAFNIVDELEVALKDAEEQVVQLQSEYDESATRTAAVFLDYTFENVDYNKEKLRTAAALRTLKKASDESKILSKRIIQEKSVLDITAASRAQRVVVEEKSAQNEVQKQAALERIRAIKAQEREEFLQLQRKKQEEARLLREEQEQADFEAKFKVLDRYVARKKILEK